MHKNIDDAMKRAEFFSPLGFLRLLLKVDRRDKYRVIQMSSKDFKDYANCAKMLRYNTIPFSKVSQLKFTRSDKYTVQYKLSHRDTKFSSSYISNEKNTRSTMTQNGKAKGTESIILSPRMQKSERVLDSKKMKHLREMLKYMPLHDRE